MQIHFARPRKALPDKRFRGREGRTACPDPDAVLAAAFAVLAAGAGQRLTPSGPTDLAGFHQ